MLFGPAEFVLFSPSTFPCRYACPCRFLFCLLMRWLKTDALPYAHSGDTGHRTRRHLRPRILIVAIPVAQESQCQTLPSPCVAGHEHGGLAGLVRVREPRRPEPVLPAGVGEPAPVSRVAETLPAAAPPSPSPSAVGRRPAQGAGPVVGANGGRARRRRAGRQRRVPSAVTG